MKKIVFSALLAAACLCGYAQYDPYTTTGSWSPNIFNTFSVPPGCPLAPLTLPGGLIDISGGRVNFQGVPGACEHRMWKPLGTLYDRNFNIDFDLNMTSSFTGASLLPMVLSSGNLNPSFTIPMTSCAQMNPMDVLAVSFNTPSAYSPANPQLGIFLMDNGVVQSTPGSITISYDTTYFVRVLIYGNQSGELRVFANSERSQLVGSFCFDFPESVNRLAFMQHAVHSGSGRDRVTNGWLDNSNVYTTDEQCCMLSLSGPKVICDGDKGKYTINTNGVFTGFSISPSDVIAGINPNNGMLIVPDWGTVTSAPKEVTITVYALCQCDTISSTYTVYVYPSTDPVFNITGLGSSGSMLTNFSATSSASIPGTLHSWELYLSDAAATPISLIRGLFTQLSTGSGSTWNINASTPLPQLITNTYYLVRQRTSFEDAICKPQASTRLIYISDAGRAMDISGEEALELGPQQIALLNNRSLEAGDNIRVFPNPTSGMVNIEAGKTVDSWELLDAGGRVLRTHTENSSRFRIDMSTYAKGMYFLRMHSGGKIYTDKISIQ
ncbi:MAG: T9SS type A sorting domain-containing protein [Bacteroidia bacterium]|nr:T9SS type A sorting domain-containing protein [Bacteroidia bacterium]